ncbi:tumor necrosis factor ligand superfamily member 6-like [Carcharodon carcharias]|uniref:Fas ligand member b n=1 Tax=Carcharodon carcharias TaxID=13397 RepID=UPI001B7F557B|nr:Fas ligand member b [Carcharodon carcharias]
MQRRNLNPLQKLDSEDPPSCQPTIVLPDLPDLRIEKKLGCLKVCHFVIVSMLFIALTGLVFGICYIYQLQQDVEQLKQKIKGGPQNGPEKQIGAEDMAKPKNEVKMAAHLTGKATSDHSSRLMWENTLGHAFTQGIVYKDGALIINETGQYFIYSKVYFRGMQCEAVPLQQTVFKHTDSYQNDLSLMKISVINYCSDTGTWGKNTFQAGIFQLSERVRLFVSVSHPGLVSDNELMTFFGVYKL